METLRLTNFRCFDDSGDIRIAPLTLLLGQNSSGKSTFARLFPLLRQTSEVLAREPLLWFGRFVDFGSIGETWSKLFPDQPLADVFLYAVEAAKGLGIDLRFFLETHSDRRSPRKYCTTVSWLFCKLGELEFSPRQAWASLLSARTSLGGVKILDGNSRGAEMCRT